MTESGYHLLIRVFSLLEHLNVITLLGDNVRSSPVAGLRPLCCFLYLTWNLPNLDIMTSSPDLRTCFMISNNITECIKLFPLANIELTTETQRAQSSTLSSDRREKVYFFRSGRRPIGKSSHPSGFVVKSCICRRRDHFYLPVSPPPRRDASTGK